MSSEAEENRIKARNNVAREIVATEETYVDGLGYLVGYYLGPMKSVGHLNDAESKIISSNINHIIVINRELLNSLQSRMAEWKENDNMGDVLNKLIPWLKLYGEYCIAEGTPVGLSNGLSIPIEEVNIGQSIPAYDFEVSDLLPNVKVSASLCKGKLDCVRVVFEDGRDLVCTPDHHILVSSGDGVGEGPSWLPVKSVSSSHKVIRSAIYHVPDQCKTASDSSPLTIGRWNTVEHREALLAWARLCGASCGNLAVPEKGIDHNHDINAWLSDLSLLRGYLPTYNDFVLDIWSKVQAEESPDWDLQREFAAAWVGRVHRKCILINDRITVNFSCDKLKKTAVLVPPFLLELLKDGMDISLWCDKIGVRYRVDLAAEVGIAASWMLSGGKASGCSLPQYHDTVRYGADGHCMQIGIKYIEEVGERNVYDLVVPQTENFIAGSVVVHNCSNYQEATELVQKKLRKKEFKEVHDKIKESANLLDLQSYLIMPIQRIPRYRMLLEQMVKYTPEDHSDYQNLVNGLKKVATIADQVNETVRTRERLDKLGEVAKRLSGAAPKDLVSPLRAFVHEGALTKQCRKTNKPRYFILFSDMLVYGEEIGGGDVKVHRTIPFDTGKVISMEDNEKYQNAFTIVGKEKSFVVWADSKDGKQVWLSALEQCKDMRRVFRETLAPSFRPNTDQEGNVVEAAPLWVNDKESKCCMLCHEKFSIRKRRHHCRKCGTLVCAKCSEHRVDLPNLGKARVCDDCYADLRGAIPARKQARMERSTTSGEMQRTPLPKLSAEIAQSSTALLGEGAPYRPEKEEEVRVEGRGGSVRRVNARGRGGRGRGALRGRGAATMRGRGTTRGRVRVRGARGRGNVGKSLPPVPPNRSPGTTPPIPVRTFERKEEEEASLSATVEDESSEDIDSFPIPEEWAPAPPMEEGNDTLEESKRRSQADQSNVDLRPRRCPPPPPI